MPDVDVVDKTGKAVSKVTLPDALFGGPVRADLVHEAVRNIMANRRQGTASTKTMGEVSGGGAKPWRQKGTGRARIGSIRAPHWKGGGTVFGPKPRDYGYRIPKKVRRAAFRSALAARLQGGDLVVVDEIRLEEPKTKLMRQWLEGLDLAGAKLLIILGGGENDALVARAARNLPTVKIVRANEVNTLDVVAASKVLLPSSALKMMEEVYSA